MAPTALVGASAYLESNATSGWAKAAKATA